MTVLSGHNLRLPANSQANAGALDLRPVSSAIDSVVSGISFAVGGSYHTLNSLFVKFKFVDGNGHMADTSGKAAKSSLVPMSSNPEWGKESDCAVLTSAEGIAENSYVRLELLATTVNNIAISETLGAIFIPYKYFGKVEQTYSFILTRFRHTNLSGRESGSSFGLGELKVRIKLIEEDAEGASARILFRSKLIERSIFSSTWYAECVPAGSADFDSLADARTVAPTSDGLLIFDHGNQIDVPNSSGYNLRETTFNLAKTLKSTGNDFATSYNSVVDSNKQTSIDIEVFENQRRAPPLMDWSKHAISRPNFSDLTYKRPFTGLLADATPPTGFEWQGDWHIDTSYIPTDKNGWCYGLSFGAILSNFYQNKSSTSPINAFARRRKWVRQAVRKGGNQKVVENVRASIYSTQSLDWRLQQYQKGYRSILGLCKEIDGFGAPLFISWDRVLSVATISESVLSIQFELERCFVEENDHTLRYKFKLSLMEMFVSNCPAMELRSLIEERLSLRMIRRNMKQLVVSGSLTMSVPVGCEEISLKENDETASVASSDGFPETVELSLGSNVIAELDNTSLLLEARIKELTELLERKREKIVELELSVLVRRNLRLRLYVAALLGTGLKGDHGFSEEEIKRLLDADFKKCQSIEMENAVVTANHRIEFLLDTAEQRVRDTALTGWEHKGGNLERSLGLLVNRFFVEIINQLANFFEKQNLQHMKVIDSSVKYFFCSPCLFFNYNGGRV